MLFREADATVQLEIAWRPLTLRNVKGLREPTMERSEFLFGNLGQDVFGQLESMTAVPQTAAMVPAWLPFAPRFWALATGWAMLLAGLALMSGILATLAAWLLTALLLSFGVFVWMPKILIARSQHIPWGGTGVTLACAGAARMVAEVLTNHSPAGEPSRVGTR